MTNAETIAAIKEHQECGFVHPLTCGNDSRHAVLVGVEVDGKVQLKCPDCDYVQGWVPGFATSDFVSKMKEYMGENGHPLMGGKP